MTKSDLHCIIERHKSDDETGEADAADTHDDRGLLIDLLRQIAGAVPPTRDEIDMGAILTTCTCCSAVLPSESHKPTCPMPLLESLRP